MSEKQAVSDDARSATRVAAENAQSAVSKRIVQHVFFHNSLREPLASYGPQTTAWTVVGRGYNYGDRKDFR